jgi:hypothetical protein
MAFILSAIGLAWIDRIGAQTQAIAAATHADHSKAERTAEH